MAKMNIATIENYERIRKEVLQKIEAERKATASNILLCNVLTNEVAENKIVSVISYC